LSSIKSTTNSTNESTVSILNSDYEHHPPSTKSSGNKFEFSGGMKEQEMQQTSSSGELLASSLWRPPRNVTLHREPGKSLGISIVGGKLDVFNKQHDQHTNPTTPSSPTMENFISGIFIKHVLEKSPAGQNGTLKTGDRILKVNGIDLTQATHDKAVEVIRNAESPIVFLIQSLICSNDLGVNLETDTPASPEIAPENPNPTEIPTENTIEEANKYGYTLDSLREKYNYLEGDLKLVKIVRESTCQSLGLNLSGNMNLDKASVFICAIYPNSLADKLIGGLKLGDQIIEINGNVLYGKAHSNVTPLIRGIRELDVYLVVLRNDKNMDEMFMPKKAKQANNTVVEQLEVAVATDAPVAKDTPKIEFKLVTLKKGSNGFGIAISEDRAAKLIIRGLNPNGVAFADGNFCVGDEIIAVNGLHVAKMKYDEVMQLLHGATEPVVFELATIGDGSGSAVGSPAAVSPVEKSVVEVNDPKVNKIRVGVECLIEIERGKLGLGLSIVGGSDTHLPAIVIHDIYEHGAAFKDKRLAIGDQILSINNIDLRCVPHDEALNIMRRQTSDMVSMLVLRNFEAFNANLIAHEDKLDLIIVDLNKKFGKGLGFSIIGRRDGAGVFISHIIDGGCAFKDGRLMVGDLILEVNGVDMRKAPYDDVAYCLKTLPQARVILKIGRLRSQQTFSKSPSSAAMPRKSSYNTSSVISNEFSPLQSSGINKSVPNLNLKLLSTNGGSQVDQVRF